MPECKTPGAGTGRFETSRSGRSGRLKVARSLLAALGDDLVGDLLAFHEGAHPGPLDGADVHEHVLGAVSRLDESEALLGIEELHGTCRHCSFPCVDTLVNRTRAHRAPAKHPSFGR